MAVKQRRKQANYLNVAVGGSAENYELMGAGFVDLNESPSAQTSSKKYITDKSATKSIVGYDWSTEFTADLITSEAAIKYIVGIAEKQAIGYDAETSYVIVDLDSQTTPVVEGEYNARKIKVAIEVASFGSEDGEMTCEGNLLGKGDFVEGKFNIKTKTFTSKTA